MPWDQHRSGNRNLDGKPAGYGRRCRAGPRLAGRGDDLPGMRITLHSPLDCPSCGSRFEGTWIPGGETSGQACPCCGEVFTATWKGWTFTPEQRVVTRSELSLAYPPERW
jgi:hypothetical protein